MGDAFADDWAPPQYEGGCDHEAGNKQKVTVLVGQEKRRELVRKAVAPCPRRHDLLARLRTPVRRCS